MRYQLLFAVFMLVLPSVARGDDEDARAMALAKETLTQGAILFDKRDAVAMAATFIETAELCVIMREGEPARSVIESKKGRAEIERAYADIFKDRSPEHKSQNTVDSARFLSPDLLLIHGRFALNRDQGDAIRFVQIRSREGDQWKVATMQLMEMPK